MLKEIMRESHGSRISSLEKKREISDRVRKGKRGQKDKDKRTYKHQVQYVIYSMIAKERPGHKPHKDHV